MRISTNMMYAKGVTAMQSQSAQLLHTQQQVATGRRVLTPADDPIAAARMLDVGQSKAVNGQFSTNQGNADDQIKLVESRLGNVVDVLQYVRERAVQAGNDTLTPADRSFIAADMRAQFEGLLALANSQDATGEYLFAGYKAQTKPFEGGLGGVNYAGDQGSRTIQVSASRFMPVSVAGSEVFDNTRTLDEAISVHGATGNAGTGSLTVRFDPATRTTPDMTGRRYEVSYSAGNFTIVERVPGGADVTTTVAAAAMPTVLNGLEIDLTGTMAEGDRFEVMVASKNVFENLSLFIDALERPGPGGSSAAVGFVLQNVDAGVENVLRVRAQLGSQMVELDSLKSLGGDLDLQYAQTMSRLGDVDMADAISRLTQQQTFLQAAQQSFMRLSNLSLFNFLN